MPMKQKACFAFSVVLAASTFAASARAGDSATAQALFDEAKRLMSQHDYAAACSKFEESQRQDPGLGTLFHLADCEERLGKTASAWAAFKEVAAEARAHAETSRATVASDRAQALEERLARLTIEPGAVQGTPGLEILRDGKALVPAELSAALPVDPGSHVIEARAPGKGTWSTTVEARDGARLVVTIPLLADVPEPATPAPVVIAPPSSPPPTQPSPLSSPSPSTTSMTTTTSADMPSSSPGSAQRATGLIVGAAGLAGLGVGAYFGVVSLDRHHDAESHCTGNACDATGVSLRDDARQAGNASTVAFAAGGALLLGGVITYALAPRATEYRPTVAVGPGSLMISGRW
jgi:serine/threonine-protein kinase